jgi:hypothetical protein
VLQESKVPEKLTKNSRVLTQEDYNKKESQVDDFVKIAKQVDCLKDVGLSQYKA